MNNKNLRPKKLIFIVKIVVFFKTVLIWSGNIASVQNINNKEIIQKIENH